jgi:hypothetical protein
MYGLGLKVESLRFEFGDRVRASGIRVSGFRVRVEG